MIAWKFELELAAYPRGEWFFNPLAWQLIFVFGAWCALGGAARLADVIRSRAALALAIAYLVFSFAISLTWYSPALDQRVPLWLTEFDLSGRQDQSRRAALRALPRARDR